MVIIHNTFLNYTNRLLNVNIGIQLLRKNTRKSVTNTSLLPWSRVVHVILEWRFPVFKKRKRWVKIFVCKVVFVYPACLGPPQVVGDHNNHPLHFTSKGNYTMSSLEAARWDCVHDKVVLFLRLLGLGNLHTYPHVLPSMYTESNDPIFIFENQIFIESCYLNREDLLVFHQVNQLKVLCTIPIIT